MKKRRRGSGEHLEQKVLIDWWSKQHPKLYNCLFAIPNGAALAGGPAQRAMQMNKLKAEGLLPGVSDLFLMISSGEYNGIFIEMKDKGKTRCSVSNVQWEHILLAREHGFAATWCAGSKEAIQVITDYLNGNYEESKF